MNHWAGRLLFDAIFNGVPSPRLRLSRLRVEAHIRLDSLVHALNLILTSKESNPRKASSTPYRILLASPCKLISSLPRAIALAHFATRVISVVQIVNAELKICVDISSLQAYSMCCSLLIGNAPVERSGL